MTQKITAVIIDDEKHVREGFYGIIKRYCTNIDILGLGDSANQGITLIKDTNPDLVFLDVQMPEKSGFDMLKEIKNVEFDVIFTTSFDKYALKAIKCSAVDYLIKPVNIAELQMAISKYSSTKKENINVLLENLNNPLNAQKIVIKHSKGIKYVYDFEIIRCQGDGNYSKVFFNDKTNLLIAKTLKEFVEILPNDKFLRVHQSHIINIDYIKAYKNGRGGSLEMMNGDEITVARSKKKEVIQILGK